MNYMKRKRLNEILDRTRGKHYLHLVETSVLQIPERLAEYDENMFICFNSLLRGEYEVHSLRNKGDTHSLSVPWPDLDQRLLELVAKRDLNRRPLKDIIREIDEHNEAILRDRQRFRDNEISGMAKEAANHLFKKNYAMSS